MSYAAFAKKHIPVNHRVPSKSEVFYLIENSATKTVYLTEYKLKQVTATNVCYKCDEQPWSKIAYPKSLWISKEQVTREKWSFLS